jgi:hypothetical protein
LAPSQKLDIDTGVSARAVVGRRTDIWAERHDCAFDDVFVLHTTRTQRMRRENLSRAIPASASQLCLVARHW